MERACILSDKPGRNKVLVARWSKPPMNVMVRKKEGAGRKSGGRSKRGRRGNFGAGAVAGVIGSIRCCLNQVVSPPSSITWKPISLLKMTNCFNFRKKPPTFCVWLDSLWTLVDLIQNQKFISNIRAVRTDVWHKFLKYFFCVLLCLTLLQSYHKLFGCEGSITYIYQNIFPQLKKCAGF